MYVGVLTIVIAWAALFQTVAIPGYAACVALCFHLFIVLYEERHLALQFGDEYDRYRSHVGRWLPHFRNR